MSELSELMAYNSDATKIAERTYDRAKTESYDKATTEQISLIFYLANDIRIDQSTKNNNTLDDDTYL